MPDNITFANTGTGAVPNATVVRTRQVSSGQHVQAVDVAPMVLTAVTGAQYALSVLSSSVRTLTVPSSATHCWVSVDPAATTVRWTRDGVSPTSANGHALVAGDSMEFDQPGNLRMIATSGTSTTQVSYHRYI